MKFPGTQAFVNQIVLYTLVALAGGGSVGLGAVWMQQQITITAGRNKGFERDIARLKRELDSLNAQVQQESSPSVLEQRNLDLGLGLEQVPPYKVTTVAGDARLRLAAKREAPVIPLDLTAYARFSRPEDR